MNYEQARQLGPDSEAPGKWNWTTMHDGQIATAPPCWYPDIDWLTVSEFENVGLTGRQRCDHDTKEEAERHQWRDELAHVRLEKLDLATARQRLRCDVPDCPDWEDYRAEWPGGWGRFDSLCAWHATFDQVVELHPFSPDRQVIHS